ncbi:hypothetical protein BDZ97DRAFT_1791637 [Flammula alnicola]|nr:hypothetical protein BDZ97DRAFT_1791637 [Flammula alnicola]
MESKRKDNEVPKKPGLFKHGSHHDISRWHLNLHPSVVKTCARNPLPNSLGQFFHPTRATLVVGGGGGMTQKWTSRDHRKNRHVYKSPTTQQNRYRDSLWGKLALMRTIEYWNISWWVAQAFTWGSVVWVINGFAAFLPFCNSHFQKASHSTGWTAFIGATIFEVGSIFGILEAWNRDDTTSFGWNVKKALHHLEGDVEAGHKSGKPHADIDGSETPGSRTEDEKPRKKWVWFSTDTMYWHELGWCAAFFQLLAASIFWISGFTAIPTIQDAIENHTGLLDGVFWTPQVIGGTGFIISSIFIMLESQQVWWKPRPQSLGWQVGVWNFIGGIGFTLSGAFGYSKSSWAQYESALSTFWGGWAFLIGSLIQWYESVNSV